MKKILVLFLAILATVVLSVSVLAAANLTCGSTGSGKVQLGSGNNTSEEFGLSAHVTASYCSSTGDSYVAATYNDKGVGRVYGTGSGTSNIYYKSGNDPTVNSSTSFDSGWTKIGE